MISGANIIHVTGTSKDARSNVLTHSSVPYEIRAKASPALSTTLSKALSSSV